MAYYKPKSETGNEYVMAAREFYTYSLNKCMRLPQRWYNTILKPVIESAERVRDNTIKANRMYNKHVTGTDFSSSLLTLFKPPIKIINEIENKKIPI